MHKTFEEHIHAFIENYTREKSLQNVWRQPIVRFADAKSPYIRRLRELVIADHYMPEDLLGGATVILTYFLPFVEEVGLSNAEGHSASPLWAATYTNTNEMAVHINGHLAAIVEGMDYRAAVPHDAGTISPEVLYSRWSQRHIAYAAGHGTFGINNMLISGKGCVGRYFSIVTDLPVPPDAPLTQERCAHKRDGSCDACIARCPAQALQPSGFARKKCYAMCVENAALYDGAKVCGKCVVDLPCSYIE